MSHMKYSTYIVIFIILISTSDLASSQEHRVFNDHEGRKLTILQTKDEPLTISETEYVKSRWSGNRFIIKLKNTSKRTIIAFRYRVIYFSIFKEYITTDWNNYRKNIMPGEVIEQEIWFQWVSKYMVWYGYAVMEKIVFDDYSLWSRKDDSVFEVIVEEITSDFPIEEMESFERQLLLEKLKEIIGS